MFKCWSYAYKLLTVVQKNAVACGGMLHATFLEVPCLLSFSRIYVRSNSIEWDQWVLPQWCLQLVQPWHFTLVYTEKGDRQWLFINKWTKCTELFAGGHAKAAALLLSLENNRIHSVRPSKKKKKKKNCLKRHLESVLLVAKHLEEIRVGVIDSHPTNWYTDLFSIILVPESAILGSWKGRITCPC